MEDEIYCILPQNLRIIIKKFIDNSMYTMDMLIEIRIRINRPIILKFIDREYVIGNDEIICNEVDIKKLLDLISNYSLYAYEDEIKQGFITIKGGHRVGVAGKVIMDANNIRGLKNISFLNIRLAHQVKGCAKKILPYIIRQNKVLHTLIISPPGCGKTTILRDLIRLIADGSKDSIECSGQNVGVVDERSELAACYLGVPQNEIGLRTDILDCCPKSSGMLMLLRTMNPDVIAVDEIGNGNDIDSLRFVINCGCSIIATIHGETIDDIRTRPIIKRIVDERMFDRYIVLGKELGVGTIKNIFDERGNELLGEPICTLDLLGVS